MLELPYNKVAGLLPAISLKRDSNTGVFCEYCEVFINIYFEEHLRTAAFVLRPSLLLNQKHNVGWFLLRFVNLLWVFSLLISSRNHSNAFINWPAENKILSKVKYCSKGHHLESTTYAYFNVYFFWHLFLFRHLFYRFVQLFTQQVTIFASLKVAFAKFWSKKCSYKTLSKNAEAATLERSSK